MCNCCNCNCTNFNQLGGLGMQPMGGMGMGFSGFSSLTPDFDYEANELRKKHKLLDAAIERLSPVKVIGGLVVGAREDYINKRFTLTVEETVNEDGFEGTRRHETYIDTETISDLTRLADRFFVRQPVIIDSKTGKLLETFWVTD